MPATKMRLSRDEILASSQPHPDFEKIISQGSPPALPSGIDVITLRQVTNAAKAQAREADSSPPAGVKEREINIPLRDNTTIPALIYAPSDEAASGAVLPLFIFFHGGGFCIGNRGDDRKSNRAIALQNHVVVVSPEYRLAPEHPFPVAVYDGLDVLQWVAENTHLVHPSASVSAGLIVGGTSSGGNIANAVVYLNRDQEFPVKVTGQFLSVPPLLPDSVVPDRYRPEYLSFKQNSSISIPPPELVTLFMDAYKPDVSSPLMVPFNHPAGHTGIPRTNIQVCGLDGLRDENLIYERVLREEYSIPTRLDFYPGLPHHFWEFFPQLTEQVEQRTKDTIDGFRWLLQAAQV